MAQLESEELLAEVNGITLMGYTSGIMSGENPLSVALTYCQTHFPGITGCTGGKLPVFPPDSLFQGVPWGCVIDLETMEVIAMDYPDNYIDFDYSAAYWAMKAANED